MHKFLSFIKEFRIPKFQELKEVLNSFNKKEFYIFVLLVAITASSFLFILNKLNNKLLVDVPVKGGSITEGVIGSPTLINPVLATSDSDKDLVSIVYSGLMRKNGDGNYIEDIAQSYEVSDDGLTYKFIIKDHAKFHDGKKITADDIVYTINKIKDPTTKSPRAGWEGVFVEKIDDKTVIFKLKKQYISFLDNATIGIMPFHLWKDISDKDFAISPLNTKAIGSGPYKISSVSKNKDGIPEEYILKRFSGFLLGTPNIKSIRIKSYSNEKDLVKALTDGEVDQAGGISPKNAKYVEGNHLVNTAETSRIFGLFYNSANNKIFADVNILNAINYTINKQEIVDKVLYGYGSISNSPIPSTILEQEAKDNFNNIDKISKANEILEKAGWKMSENGIRQKGGISYVEKTKKVGKKTVTEKVKVNNGPIVKLEFSLTTGDTPELRLASETIKSQLEKVGISVNIERVYEIGSLNQVIRNREYEALFFGQVINHESDLYSFWHSSQRKDPGLNIAMYNNARVDKTLEDIQKINKIDDRLKKYESFINEFNKDLPAILIYSPKYLYVTSNGLNNMNLDSLTNSSDRFNFIYQWYANKDRVWKIFTKN